MILARKCSAQSLLLANVKVPIYVYPLFDSACFLQLPDLAGSLTLVDFDFCARVWQFKGSESSGLIQLEKDCSFKMDLRLSQHGSYYFPLGIDDSEKYLVEFSNEFKNGFHSKLSYCLS